MLTTSTIYGSPPKPGWHTDELEEEWIEPEITGTEHHQHEHSISNSRFGRSFVDNGPSFHAKELEGPPSPAVQGTFIVREDQPPAAILPGATRNNKGKNAFKYFFSPLALETMFEPPTQNHEAQKMSATVQPTEDDVIVASDIPNLACFDGRKPSCNYRFTFSASQAARQRSSSPPEVPRPNSEEPPLPTTDPRLRLFQFQYDTFTREHLSALVDSIAHTPLDSSKTPPSILTRSRLDNQPPETSSDEAYLRATKRLKLSPPSAVPPSVRTVSKRPRKDYIGESRNLMRQIKQARSPSMMTIFSVKESTEHKPVKPCTRSTGEMCSVWFNTTTSPSVSMGDHGSTLPSSSCLRPSTAHASTSIEPLYPGSTLNPTIPSSLFSSASDSPSKPSTISSSLGYRRQAADLMAQIREDMTKGKRIFSLESLKDLSLDDPDASLEKVPLRVSVTPASPTTRSGQTGAPQSSQENSVSSQFTFPTVTESQDQRGSLPRKIPKRSPRKLLRRLSAADEVDREIAMNKTVSDISFEGQPKRSLPIDESQISNSSQARCLTSRPQQDSVQAFHDLPAPTLVEKGLLKPPSFSIPIESNRVVSSGTSASVETTDSALTNATTVTSATSLITLRTSSIGSVDSAASFVKHPGPVQITRITPQDVPSLPDTVGGMRFDRVSMRWIKAGPSKQTETGLTVVSEESDDPFRDFESLHSGGTADHTEMSGAEVHSSRNESTHVQGEEFLDERMSGDEQSAVMPNVEQNDSDTDDSFDFDAENGGVVDVMTGEASQVNTDLETTDFENESFIPHKQEQEAPGGPTDQSDEEQNTVKCTGPRTSILPALPNIPSATPPPTHRIMPPPPRSALKNPISTPKPPISAIRTPQNLYNSSHRRSVSFSDGRREGKILGLTRDSGTDGPTPLLPVEGLNSLSPSARGRRIAAVLDHLANTSSEDQTPLKRNSTSQLSYIDPQHPKTELQSQLFTRTFSKSLKGKDFSLAPENQTLLTECSFGIARDKLVHVITDVHPYVPYWETLGHIDLSNKGIDSVVKLKEFLPQLDELNLDNNMIAWLTGIPKTIRTLSVSSNILTSMTSFDHLRNLEVLHICNNQLESLKQLSCLPHLQELKADGNSISNLDGIEDMPCLLKFTIKGNHIRTVNFNGVNWPKLRILDLSRNGILQLSGLSSLPSITALNLDHNNLECLKADKALTKLRVLRVSNNRLRRLEVSCMPHIRTMYADNNMLNHVQGLPRLRRLENLSLRNQGSGQLTLNTHDIRDVKRLYLSGNPLNRDFITLPCYNLIYLEVAACRLTELPRELAQLIPNIRVLNLNYNFLSDSHALHGLSRLRKLTLIGSRLKGTKELVRTLRQMPEMEMIDFRMNPCTLGWYLPILVQDIPGALQPSENTQLAHQDTGGEHQSKTLTATGPRGVSWQDLDSKFRNDLPDEAYVGRLAYRGLVMRACPKIKMLDGVSVETAEREKAEKLLRGVLLTK